MNSEVKFYPLDYDQKKPGKFALWIHTKLVPELNQILWLRQSHIECENIDGRLTLVLRVPLEFDNSDKGDIYFLVWTKLLQHNLNLIET